MNAQQVLEMIQSDLEGASEITGGSMNPQFEIAFGIDKRVNDENHIIGWHIYPNRVVRKHFVGSDISKESWDIDGIAKFLEPHVIFHHNPRMNPVS